MKRLPFTPAMFEAAFLYHRKTVTRRLRTTGSQYYKTGETVVAVTTWSVGKKYDDKKPSEICVNKIWIGNKGSDAPRRGKMRAGRFLPRMYEFLFPKVRIVSVRLEHLQDITADDAILEGATMRRCYHGPGYNRWWSMDWAEVMCTHTSALTAFVTYWNRIHGPGAWDKNPPVWRVEFEEVRSEEMY